LLKEKKRTFDLITEDHDWQELRQGYNAQFFKLFIQMYDSYKKGDWTRAISHLPVLLEQCPTDGPTLVLEQFMLKQCNGVRPDDWTGSRILTEK
jgi:hypothetical protein